MKTSSHPGALDCRLSKNHKTPAHHTGTQGIRFGPSEADPLDNQEENRNEPNS